MFFMTYNLSKVGQIAQKYNCPRNKTIEYTVLKFWFDSTCLQGEEVRANFVGK